MSEQKTFIATNWFKLFIVALSLFLIAIYFHRESELDDCLAFAEKSYSEQWTEQCADEKKSGECKLNPFTATAVNGFRDKRINECYRRYSFR